MLPALQAYPITLGLLPPHTWLRAMSSRDLPPVVALEQQAYEFPWSSVNFTSSLAAGYFAECLYHTPDYQPDSLLGYYIAMPGVDEMHLLNITVRPTHQGQGYGKALLELVKIRSQQHQAQQLWLEVRASNLKARRVYQRFGFSQISIRRGYYPTHQGREDAVVMRLNWDL